MARNNLYTVVAAFLIAAFGLGCESQNNPAATRTGSGGSGTGGAPKGGAGGASSGLGGAGGRSTDVATGGQAGTGIAAGGTAIASQGGVGTGGAGGGGFGARARTVESRAPAAGRERAA